MVVETGQSGARKTAIVTASYAGDLARFALLAETMDRHVHGWTRHLVLVASRDVALFQRFAGPKRQIIDEADLLPFWLRRFADPLSGFKRDIWLSPFTWPMRGWHVQQLRRLAICRHIDEDAILHADSDVAFIAPYDVGSNWRQDRLRLYCIADALQAPGMEMQRQWARLAAKRLGLAQGEGSHDYINTLVPWSVPAARRMLDRLEQINKAGFVSALGRDRTFSECTLYGRYVDEVELGAGHFASADAHCRVYWTGPALNANGIGEFISTRQPHQVAIGLQSFVGISLADIRKALCLA
jgi:hypothetical protein